MSAEDKFYAAVNVIRNLPKNGSYQPSNELMLRFYSYYKQATEGPNRKSKPSFWDLTNRAKWEAWASLGNMSKEDAMTAYVEELNKIVETMAYTDNVADFLSSLNSFYTSVPAEEVEMCIGPALEKVRSRNTSPAPGSPETSPSRQKPDIDEDMLSFSDDKYGSEQGIDQNDVEEEDYFLDTFDYTESESKDKSDVADRKTISKSKYTPVASAFIQEETVSGLNPQVIPNGTILMNGRPSLTDNVHEVLQRAVESLCRDLSIINDKVKRIEDKQRRVVRNGQGLFGNLSRPTVMFIIGWPLFIHLVFMWFFRRKRRPVEYMLKD